MEFEMKDLGRTKFCLGLQLEHPHACILRYQFAYVQKVLEMFNMEKETNPFKPKEEGEEVLGSAYPHLSIICALMYLANNTHMIVHALEKETNPFKLKEKSEEVLGPEYPYLSAISVLIYLANNTRSDIGFIVNCLAGHSVAPKMRHWNNIKNIL
jgi:hypothetical protein